MRPSYLDYAMSVIVGPGAARRARRPQARPPPRPLRDARHGPPAEPALRQEREHRRRGDGQVPPPRRLGDLRHPGPHGAGLRARATRWSTARATSARRRVAAAAMRYTEARLVADRDRDAARHRPGDGRLRPELRRPRSRAARSCRRAFPNLLVNGSVRHRRRHGDQHPAAQPRRDRSTRSSR